jgi:predicted O-methyltransferase YrrM
MARHTGRDSIVWTSAHEFTVGGIHYSVAEFGVRRPRPRMGSGESTMLSIYKSREQVEAFVDLVADIPASRVVELGIGAGGSAAVLAQLLRPTKLVAMDIVREPVPSLECFLDTLGLRDRVRPYYAVDQADRDRLATIVDQEFDGESIDLVIDDASHQPEPTRASFEVLFPRVSSDGLFVIEDWSWEHAMADKVAQALSSESPSAPMPGRELLQTFEAAGMRAEMLAPLRSGELMSDVVSDIVVGKADGDATIGDVTIRPFTTEVRRGPTAIATGGPSACLQRGVAPRGLYIGRLDAQVVAHIRTTGIEQLVVVSDEPPGQRTSDLPETIHVHCSPPSSDPVAIARQLGPGCFALVIDGASLEAHRARELASVLLPRVEARGAYMLRGWPGFVAPRTEREGDLPRRRMPMLMLELMLAVAEWNDTIEEIVFGEEWLTVRRGSHRISIDGFDVSNLYRDHFGSLLRS